MWALLSELNSNDDLLEKILSVSFPFSHSVVTSPASTSESGAPSAVTSSGKINGCVHAYVEVLIQFITVGEQYFSYP